MPGMDGLELQRCLNEAQRQVPIIFITAHATESEEQRARKAGAVDFLRKPVNDEKLLSAIQTALKASENDERSERMNKMKIVVIGGSGLIGTKLVNNLRQRGHEVVAASPSSGVNTLTGEGLADALKGAQVVVDVANAPSWEDKAVLEFFETSGRNLLAAEAAAGVKHHVALSVVGTDRLLASGYFRAKMAQEKLIKASQIPYTIVRSTQFFEFVRGIAQNATEGATVRLPSVLMQPIAVG